LRQQQEWLRQQQEAQAQAQAQAQQQAAQEEWFRQQQLQAQQQQQQQALFAQPTGFGYVIALYGSLVVVNLNLYSFSSNNPFAPASSPIPVSSGTPVNGTSGPSFNLQGTYSNSNAPSYNSSPVPSQVSSPSPGVSSSIGAGAGRGGPSRADQEHSHLASLFANRDDGQDTFGNVGALRYGHTQAGLLAAQKTGFGTKNNPFQLQQQQQGQNAEQPFFSI
jgi:epsin